MEGQPAAYRVFSKDQHGTQTAIVENKRPSHAPAIVKDQQALKLEAKVLTNSEKTGYKQRPRNLYGPDHVGKKPAPTARRRLLL